MFSLFNRTPYRNQPRHHQQQSSRRRPLGEQNECYLTLICAILILISMFAVYLIFWNELWTRCNVSTLFCFLDIVGIWKLKINGKSFALFLRLLCELTRDIYWNYCLCKSANRLTYKNPVLGIQSQFKIPFREMS